MMRRLTVALLVLSALFAACGSSEWRDLEVSEGAFAVIMRGQPQYVRQDINTPAGKMTAHLYSSDRPDTYYAVGYVDYPLGLVAGSPPEQLLASVRDTWVRRVQGRLIASDATLRLDGKYPGLEFSAEGSRPAAGKAPPRGDGQKPVETLLQARLYLVDQRLYQLIAMGRKGELPQGDVNRFLKSFRVIPQSEVGNMNIEPPRPK